MLLQSIKLKNLLSFRDAELELLGLNVLIGPNASGKSNLLAAIGLLKAAPENLEAAVQRGGGLRQWIHRASQPGGVAGIEAGIDLGRGDGALAYSLTFTEDDLRLYLREELKSCNTGETFFSRNGQHAKIYRSPRDSAVGIEIGIELEVNKSVFAAFRDPLDRTPITRTGQALGAIEIFREFNTGPSSTARNGVAVGSQKFLFDGGGNLALVLQELDFRVTLARLNEYLTRFWQDAEAVRIRIDGGIVQTYVKERGIEEPIPAIRLSDGTLKFLCLMAILLHPAPPALICMEEPELGLHPDALTIVADALREAAGKSQLIVTTHSEALVNALSDEPESVVVCERGVDGGTEFQRLNASALAEWMAEYRLGELWRKGEIGGNRW
jgi:predicted ATPase